MNKCLWVSASVSLQLRSNPGDGKYIFVLFLPLGCLKHQVRFDPKCFSGSSRVLGYPLSTPKLQMWLRGKLSLWKLFRLRGVKGKTVCYHWTLREGNPIKAHLCYSLVTHFEGGGNRESLGALTWGYLTPHVWGGGHSHMTHTTYCRVIKSLWTSGRKDAPQTVTTMSPWQLEGNKTGIEKGGANQKSSDVTWMYSLHMSRLIGMDSRLYMVYIKSR